MTLFFLYLLFITFVSLTKWLPFRKTFVQTFKISNVKLGKKTFLSSSLCVGQMIYRRNSGVLERPNSNSLGSEYDLYLAIFLSRFLYVISYKALYGTQYFFLRITQYNTYTHNANTLIPINANTQTLFL